MVYVFTVVEEGIARGADALSVLDATETRNMFLDELNEVFE